MPDDDPFKDEPTAPPTEPDTPAAKASDQSRRNVPGNALAAASEPMRWRVVSPEVEPAAADATTPLTPVAPGREPKLVAPPADRVAGDSRPLAAVATSQQNPLRLAAASIGRQQVVPTASWTGQPTRAASRPAAVRRNPLRNN
jgi:hypothetical protein